MLVKLAYVGAAVGIYVLSTRFPAVAGELKFLAGMVAGVALPEGGKRKVVR